MIELFSATIRQRRGMMVAMAFPLGIWAILWFGMIGEYPNIPGIVHPQNHSEFARGIAAVVPFAAAGLAMAIILFRLEDSSRIRDLFLGPLGLATVYGSVGIISAFNSPDGSVAIYWVAAYLSVPIVLWSVTLVGDTVDNLRLIINFTWAVFGVAVMLILAFGLIKLNLWNYVTHPDIWLKCPPQSWYVESSHLIRETAVGRYAAVAGIVSLSGLWQRNWRFLWAAIFLVSILLLVNSGARTSVAGFLMGAPLIILLHGGRKAAVVGSVGVALLIPAFWSTGIHHTFLDNCIWRTADSPATTAVSLTGTGALSTTTDSPATTAVSPTGTGALSTTTDSPATTAVSPTGTGALSTTTDSPATTADSPTGTGALSTTTDAAVDPTASTVNSQKPPDQPISDGRIFGQAPRSLLKLNGRTEVWSDATGLFKDSPLLGYGFHADRLLLAQHAHNSYVHALLQTGALGGVAFIAALLFAFFHLVGIIKNLDRFSIAHKQLLIGSAGVLAYLLVRSITESTGAFFSVDWLLVAPLLLYVQVMNQLPLGKQQIP